MTVSKQGIYAHTSPASPQSDPQSDPEMVSVFKRYTHDNELGKMKSLASLFSRDEFLNDENRTTLWESSQPPRPIYESIDGGLCRFGRLIFAARQL